MADRNMLEMIMRAGRGAYSGAKRGMMETSRGMRDDADARIGAREKAGADKVAAEMRGRGKGERNDAYNETVSKNKAYAGRNSPNARARAIGEANPFMGDPMGQVVNRGDMLLRQIAANNAAPGMQGDLSRAATGAAITGGITASGAALIDLMKFLTQGQQVDAQRDEVLRS